MSLNKNQSGGIDMRRIIISKVNRDEFKTSIRDLMADNDCVINKVKSDEVHVCIMFEYQE